MSLDRLRRVMWRLRARHPGKEVIHALELKRAIMYECGTDPKTYTNNRKALKALGWVKTQSSQYVRLTGNDLTET